MYIALILAVPFLFLIGVIYNSVKDQKKLEKDLPRLLEERRRRRMLPEDHPDRIYVRDYDDDEDDADVSNAARRATRDDGSAASSDASRDPARPAGAGSADEASGEDDGRRL